MRTVRRLRPAGFWFANVFYFSDLVRMPDHDVPDLDSLPANLPMRFPPLAPVLQAAPAESRRA